jgi:hypothetical protein
MARLAVLLPAPSGDSYLTSLRLGQETPILHRLFRLSQSWSSAIGDLSEKEALVALEMKKKLS